MQSQDQSQIGSRKMQRTSGEEPRVVSRTLGELFDGRRQLIAYLVARTSSLVAVSRYGA